MKFSKNYKAFWKNYVNFSGIATKNEYWSAFLINLLLIMTYLVLIGIYALFAQNSLRAVFICLCCIYITTIIYGCFALAILLPNLSIIWRRLHDTGRSGAWFFIIFVPLGFIPLIIFLCKPSLIENNKYLIKKEDSIKL